MKILITGAAGFIGSHIADACIEAGHAVTIIDDLSMGKKENVNPKATFVQLDIRSKELPGLFERGKFDAVVHLAAQMDVRKSVEDPLFDASVNILGSVNLLEQSRKCGVKKFVFASTGGAIYGEQEKFPADETHPLRPISPYGISKLSIEKYLYYYHEVFGLQYVSLRFGNVYGPRQNPHGEAGVIAIFTSKMLAGEQPVINGDGKQTRDYVYVGDVVKAALFGIQHAGSGIFNVGTGIEADVNQLFGILRELTGSSCKEIHAPAKQGEQLRSVLDTRLLQTTGSWSASMPLKEGLRKTVEFFKTQKMV